MRSQKSIPSAANLKNATATLTRARSRLQSSARGAKGGRHGDHSAIWHFVGPPMVRPGASAGIISERCSGTTRSTYRFRSYLGNAEITPPVLGLMSRLTALPAELMAEACSVSPDEDGARPVMLE